MVTTVMLWIPDIKHLSRFGHPTLIFSNTIRLSTISYTTTWCPITTAAVNYWRVRAHLAESILELKVQRLLIYNKPKTERQNYWLVSVSTFDLSYLTHLVWWRQSMRGESMLGLQRRGKDRQHLEMNGATRARLALQPRRTAYLKADVTEHRQPESRADCWAERGRQAPHTYTAHEL